MSDVTSSHGDSEQSPVDVSGSAEPAATGSTQPTEVLPPAPEPAASAAHPVASRPRIRSGAIVWGVIVSAAAVFILGIVTSPANSASFAAWMGALGWGGAVLVAVVAVGAFILIMALLSAIRGAQRRRAVR